MREPGETRGHKQRRLADVPWDEVGIDPEWDDINLFDLLPQARRGAMFPNEIVPREGSRS